MRNRLLVRNIEAGNLLENFLVAAVVSILSIRFFLFITGYPQLGDGRFHIAHMLWGGILMMAALILLFVFLNRHVKYVASVVGGVGFGAFIDELGKFITRDNNYFFQPTIAIIYIIFVLLFLAMRAFEKYVKFTSMEYAVNALEITKEVILHDLDKDEKKQALKFLKESDPGDPVTEFLRKMLGELNALPVNNKSIFSRLKLFLHENYLIITKKRLFRKATIGFFVISTLISVGKALADMGQYSNFFEWGELISTLLSGIFVVLGVYFYRFKNKLTAFEMFRFSVLTSIFLSQFFIFYREQLSAVVGLGLNIVILTILQYLISEAKLHTKRKKQHLNYSF